MFAITVVGAAVATAPPPSTTVYLMRHCARSTYLPDLYGGQKPAYLANYSDGGDLPDWGVAPTLCTARGRKLIQGQGTSLRAEVVARMGGLPIKAIYDAGSKRDNTTALDFLTGLGLATTHRRGEPEIFTPPESWCPKVSADAKMAAVKAQLKAVPKPSNYDANIDALQKILGRGVAPPMQIIPDVVSGGPVGWLGGSFVSSSWIEAMLLQFGAGLPMAYGRVKPSQLYSFLSNHVFYRAVSDKGFAIEQRGESNLLAHMMNDLSSSSKGGVSLYVGHDTNLDGISTMLSLGWPSAPPYPANTTVPGGTLRLTRTGEGANATVDAAFLYTRFEDESGKMAEVEALFPNGKATISLAELQKLADGRIDKKCVRLGKGIVEEEVAL